MKVSTGRIVEGKVKESALLAAIAQTERGQVAFWEELREQQRRAA